MIPALDTFGCFYDGYDMLPRRHDYGCYEIDLLLSYFLSLSVHMSERAREAQRGVVA